MANFRRVRDVEVGVVAGSTLRLGLGALILATGLGKLLDLAGFVEVIGTYRLGLSDTLAWVAAVMVTAIELAIGTWLLSGRGLRHAAMAAAALNLAWLVMLTAALVRGLQLDNCGCFGVFFARPLTWSSPLEDLALIGACLLLARLARVSPGVVRERQRGSAPPSRSS